MDEALTPTRSPGASDRPRQAACLACRRSKVRCNREPGDAKCRRCQQTNTECTVPHFHVGRQKGIKNKRTGLDKAVYRIEQALERSQASGGRLEDEQAALHLQQLLSKTQNMLPRQSISSDLMPGVQAQSASPHSQGHISNYSRDRVSSSLADTSTSVQAVADDGYALEDAENPLQLLARASDLPISPSHLLPAPDHPTPVAVTSHPEQLRAPNENQDLQTFFGPLTPHLDVGEDIDPIDMGFVTSSETDVLFSFFYQNLSHTRWGLDPNVHTVAFVRSRSAFLFTSILAASALFLPSTAALSKRLSAHCKNLAHRVMVNRNRSPEIVLAFMVNVPWMTPGKHWADDETCAYLAMALTVAMDLSLNKLIIPSPSGSHDGNLDSIPRSDCISARKALSLDGFEDVDPSSLWGRRLLRRRERIWLALFVLDRGVCLARGRPFTMPMTSLIETCDRWHISDLSDIWDESIISSAVLRRDLASLIADIRTTCDHDRSPTVVQTLKDMIESFFNQWYTVWAFEREGGKQKNIPPYVEILVSHTRLSTYSSVINHPTAAIEVKRFFHAAGLSSALNVMRAAVQGEGRLKSMPNNTAIMISFAACFALRLSMMVARNNPSLAPSIKILVEETADVLERIGTIPSHRKGTSALYGRHLREVVRNSIASLNTQSGSGQPGTGNVGTPQDAYLSRAGPSNAMASNDLSSGLLSFEPLLFSAMSDNQIVEAINSAGDGLETWLSNSDMNFTVDDNTGLDWLDWFGADFVA